MPRYENVLVTGASRGLGAALVRELLARGHRVVLTARSAAELAQAADALHAQHGERVGWIAADLADPAAARALVAQVEQRFGALDALINNAGIGTWKPLVDWTPQEVIACVNLNLIAPMLLSQAVLPGMVARQRGMIVNIASDLARRPLANMAPYVATKFGLLGFSGSLLREARAHGIKVSTVLPGIIDTAFNGAQEGSKDETWALRSSVLAGQVVALLELPENVLIDELTIHPLHQDF
ncbi:MAG TPA: SDR family NAD(P)-dependent oxidoreductase [Burkholderiaceae bacterium]